MTTPPLDITLIRESYGLNLPDRVSTHHEKCYLCHWRCALLRLCDELEEARLDAWIDRMNCASWEQQAEDCMRREREMATELDKARGEIAALQARLRVFELEHGGE